MACVTHICTGIAYRMLTEKLPLPSFALLGKLHTGGIDAFKAAKILQERGALSEEIILMADEMYLQKASIRRMLYW